VALAFMKRFCISRAPEAFGVEALRR